MIGLLRIIRFPLIESTIENYSHKSGSIISVYNVRSLTGLPPAHAYWLLMTSYSMWIDQEPPEKEQDANKCEIEEFRTPGTLMTVCLVTGIFSMCNFRIHFI